jgi:hypothetical protein
VDGALRVRDGQTVTLTAPSPNSVGYQDLLGAVETANPVETIMVITDNRSSHTSSSTRTWPGRPPRIQHTFIPKGACWRKLQEGWWRLFRRQAFAGQSFATPEEITLATSVATCQLNARARPGCGAARYRPRATHATPSPTGSKERSTRRRGESCAAGAHSPHTPRRPILRRAAARSPLRILRLAVDEPIRGRVRIPVMPPGCAAPEASGPLRPERCGVRPAAPRGGCGP